MYTCYLGTSVKSKSAFAGMRKARGSRRLTEPETPAMRLADRAGLSKSEVAQMEKFPR